jgi:hypothetical protein
MATVQTVAMYGAELWWKNQKNWQEELQKLINKQARTITGAYCSTPLGPLLQEASLEPAEVMLNARQRGYTARLLGLPRNHPGHQILPVSFREGDRHAQAGEQEEDDLQWAQTSIPRGLQSLGQHLARNFASTLRQDPSGGFEQTAEAYPGSFPGRIVVENTEEALKRARNIKGGLVLWSDGSRLENRGVGAGVAWRPTCSPWKTQEFPLGKGKEVFDAELLRACRALELSKTLQNSGKVTVLLDSQAAITWIQGTEPGPGQALAIRAHEAASWLQERRVKVTI